MSGLLDDILAQIDGKKPTAVADPKKRPRPEPTASTSTAHQGTTGRMVQDNALPAAKRPKLGESEAPVASALSPEARQAWLKAQLAKEKAAEEKRAQDTKNMLERKAQEKQNEVVSKASIVTNKAECEAAVARLKKQQLLAVDCEWTGTGREAMLAIVQIATGDTKSPSKVYIFDIVVGGPDLFKYGLKALLETKDVVKIFHDCRWDSDILFRIGGVVLDHVFDTQVAFAIYSQQTSNMTPFPVSLNTMLRKFASGQTNVNKDALHKAMEESPDYWLKRPLATDMIQYICEDVLHLPSVYRQINIVLDQRNSQFVFKHSKEYVDQLRTKETVDDNAKIGPSGVPRYGIEAWDRDVAKSVERNQLRSDIRGTRGSAVDRIMTTRAETQ